MKMKSTKGTRDIWGKDIKLKRLVEEMFFTSCSKFNYKEIETPLIEDSSLFIRSVGESSDIVQKEMFLIPDGDSSIALRPEGTASVLRACLENNLLEKLPLKLSYFGAMFRKEKPQKGRYRQFYQCGVEVFGEASYGVEVEIFVLIKEILSKLKIKDYIIELNNIGSFDERTDYKVELSKYFEKYESDLSQESQKRLKQNVLRILDSKDEKDMELCKNAPKIYDFINSENQAKFNNFLEVLKLLNIPYKVNPFLVRGLDYYSDLVFEIIDTSNKLGSQTALGGGGRYDKLITDLSNKQVPAFGFAFGVDRLMLCQNLDLSDNDNIDYCLISTSKTMLPLFLKAKEELYLNNIKCDINFNTNLSFKKMFQRADKIKSKFVVVVGDNEINNKQIKIKNMELGTEETIENVDYTNLASFLKII
jgi:histidyl-tRNA synthetase